MLNDTNSGNYSGKKPVPASEILAYTFRPRPPVLMRGILPAGGGLILAGDSGVGKSLMRVEWSLQLAAGLELYDIGTPAAQTVLVFQAENTITNEQFRLRRIREGLGIETTPRGLYYAPPIWPSNITRGKYQEWVIECIRGVGATVAFFDPLISYHGENENDNVKMRSVLNSFTHISRETGAAIILIHHFGKPSEAYQTNDYRLRGAQAIKDWADTAITITPAKSPEGDNVAYRRLDFIKIRSGPYHPPLVLRRDESFVHRIAEDVEQDPLLALISLVRHQGPKIAGREALAERLKGLCECGKKAALEMIQEAINRKVIIETITDGGTRGFRVP